MAVCLVNDATPTAAVSSLGFGTMDNHAPARPGDELHVRGRTLEARLSKSRPGLGIVNSRVELLNQSGELVFWYENGAVRVSTT